MGARGIGLPSVPADCDQPYHLFYLITASLGQRTRLIAHLKEHGILAVFHYLPLHLSEMGRRLGGKPGDCPVTEDLSDRLLRLPFGILLALTIVAATGPSLENLIVAVGISSMPAYVRIVNGAVLDVTTRTFIEASRASGAADLRIIGRHVVPNILAPIIVLTTLGLGNALLVAATLSFLGMGAQPPTPEWGAMLSQGREFIFGYWWIATFPGVAILLAVIGANLLGEGMRDLLDPRLRV
jgi:ABC-type dipeptide/oligopeptide/nickel transport system permease subunit